MTAAIAIRPLGADDVARYHALRQRGLVEHPEAFTSSAGEEAALAPAKLAARVARAPERPYDVVLGAFDGEALVGTCGMRVDMRTKARHRGHVFGMYVPRERCGRGIGSALVEAVVAHARHCNGLDALVLSVTAGNGDAERLYARHGFTPIGREPGAVRVAGKAYDKIMMMRWLAPAAPSDSNDGDRA